MPWSCPRRSPPCIDHVVLDLPVGPTAKIRDQAVALRLATRLRQVGGHFGLVVDLVLSDGSPPVGRGIGTALEAARSPRLIVRNIAAATRTTIWMPRTPTHAAFTGKRTVIP